MNKKMTIEELLIGILNLFENIDKDRDKLSSKLSKYDKRQDEVLHYIENHKLDAKARCKVVELLQKNREKRREVKNQLDIIRFLKENFITKYKNKFIEKDVIQTLKGYRELQQKQNNPKYTYQFLTEELEFEDDI